MKKIFLTFVAIYFCQTLFAQHFTSSPYSFFGIGEIDKRSYSLDAGMASAGTGLLMNNYINPNNPAALSVDSLSFIFDVAVSSKFSNFPNSIKFNNTNINRLAIGFRVFNKLNLSLGVSPYSSMEYRLQVEEQYVGSNNVTYMKHYEGSGGTAKAFLAARYKLFNDLSVGLKSSYLFGSLYRSEILGSDYVRTESSVKDVLWEFGLLYNKNISSNNNLAFGATYSPKKELTLANEKIIYISQTIEQLKSTKSTIPQEFKLGASYNTLIKKSALTLAVDYSFANWASVSSTTRGVSYDNSSRFNVGMQITPNMRTPKSYMEVITYQCGGFYQNGPYVINGHKIQEMGVTIGAIFPLMKNKSSINFSGEYGYKGGNGLISEKFIRLNLGISLNEIWFYKWFYD